MLRSLLLRSLPLLLSPSLALAADTAAKAPLPTPLVRLEFSRDLVNHGSLGGEGSAITYAAAQGPAFGTGIRGTGASFAASARGGGSDQTRAGGAIRLKTPGLGQRDQVTLCLWFRAIGPNAPARLLYLGPCWDLSVGGRSINFKIRHERKDVSFTPGEQRFTIDEYEWNFLALTIDRTRRETRFYHAPTGEAPKLVATWSEMPTIDSAEADLEIGNLDGIRPFRGLIDSVLVCDSILSPDQIQTVAQECRQPRPAKNLHTDPTPSPPPLFTHSDVCLSSRSMHPNSVQTVRDFRANRLLWTYAVDRQFADACRAAGISSYQGAINSLPGSDESEAHALDLDAHPMVAPWMAAFNRKHPVYWGCNNRPRFMEISLERARAALEAGADSLQFDDWSLVVSAGHWGGGCLCQDCVAGFRRDLKEHASPEDLARLGIKDLEHFDYRLFLKEHLKIQDARTYLAKKRDLPTTPFFEAFQRRSVRRFFTELRRALDSAAGHTVPLSINATLLRPSQQENYIVDLVDFVQGETLHFQPAEIALAARTAEALGKWHVFVPESLDTRDVRAGIATTYALGQLPLVPWDMYMGSDEHSIQPRGWGTVTDYGDLFHFARDHSPQLDRRETVATVALVLDTDHLDRTRALAVCQRLLDAQVPFAIVPVGHAFVDLPLSEKRLAPFETIVLVGDPNTWTSNDRAALCGIALDRAVIDADQLTDENCRELSWFDVWGPRNLHIFPRRSRDRDDPTLLCHVVNPGAKVSGMKWISFVLTRNAHLDAQVTSALWHTPGNPPKRVDLEEIETGTRIILPTAPVWGIAELRFSSPADPAPCKPTKE